MTGKRNISPWILLAACGLTSAILCITPPALSGWFGICYVGAVYGALLGVPFLATRGVRTVPRIAALVMASTAAWPIAYLGSFWTSKFIPGATVHHGDAIYPAFPLLFVGGVMGGIALLIPLVLLFRPPSVSVGHALGNAVLGILLSGIVGGIAWDLGPTLGKAIWGLIPAEPLPRPDSYGMGALFFVWQPVVALFIGWATSGNEAAQPHSAETGLQTQTTPGSGGISRRAFGGILVALAAVSLTAIVPVRLRLAHRERAEERKRESKPVGVDLPLQQAEGEEEALILRQIGDYQPGHAIKTVESVSHEGL